MKVTSPKLEQILANTPSNFELMTRLHEYTEHLWHDPEFQSLLRIISKRLQKGEAK